MAEIDRVNQTVRPRLRLDRAQVVVGGVITARLDVVIDGDAIDGVIVEIGYGGTRSTPATEEMLDGGIADVGPPVAVDGSGQPVWATRIAHLGARAAHHLGSVAIDAPPAPGWHVLALRLRARGGVVAEHVCTVHVTEPGAAVPGDTLAIDEARLADGRRVARYSRAQPVAR